MSRKAVPGLILMLLLIGMLTLAFNIQPVRAEPKTWTVDDDGPADFHSIQEAINAANEGDTVFVMNGTYYEHVVVNKTISLIGENRDTTIVDGKAYTPVLMYVSSDKVTVKGFMMRNAWIGIHLNSTSECLVSNNNIGNLILDGISLGWSSNCSISNNNLNNNGDAGIVLFRCSNISVLENVVNNNRHVGLDLFNSSNCFISQNTVNKNGYGISMQNSSSNNKIFHNNFIKNRIQARIVDHCINTWDNDYPSGGNYWSDYNTTDLFLGPYQNITGKDGIGDEPYVIDEENQDNYPLMKPHVPGSLTVSIYTDKYTYHAGDTMYLGLNVTNPDSVKHLDFYILIAIRDKSGKMAVGIFMQASVVLPIGLSYSNPSFRTFTLTRPPDHHCPCVCTWYVCFCERSTHKVLVQDTAEWQFV